MNTREVRLAPTSRDCSAADCEDYSRLQLTIHRLKLLLCCSREAVSANAQAKMSVKCLRQWDWANQGSSIPEALTQSSRTLREFGTSNGIDELCGPKFKCEGVDGHSLSMPASGVCKADGYYCCPYDGGAAFVLVDFGGAVPEESPLLLRMNIVFTDFISGFDVANERGPSHYTPAFVGRRLRTMVRICCSRRRTDPRASRASMTSTALCDSKWKSGPVAGLPADTHSRI